MTDMTLELDRKIPMDRVLATARSFLDEVGWELEFEGRDSATERVVIPPDAALIVASRAFVRDDIVGLSFGDHFTAIVLIGADGCEKNPVPEFGILRLYFDFAGNFITEDRFREF